MSDFNPREDVVIIPVNATGNSSVLVSADSTLDSDMALKYSTDSDDTFAVLDFSDDFTGSTLNYASREALGDQLQETAIVMDSDGVYVNGEEISLSTLGISDEVDLSDLGDGKYMVLGAFSGHLLEGDNSSNYLYGTDFSDTLAGYQLTDDGDGQSSSAVTADDDEFYGFDGDDLIFPGGGSNKVFAGEGTDIVSYAYADEGVILDLTNTDTEDTYGTPVTVENNGFSGNDTLYGVEGVVGGDYDDSLVGDDNQNYFYGGEGSDTLTTGDDVTLFSEDADSFDDVGTSDVVSGIETIIASGSGATADYSNFDGPLTVTLDDTGTVTVVNSYASSETYLSTYGEEIDDSTYTLSGFEYYVGTGIDSLVPSGQVNLDDYSISGVTDILTGSVTGTDDAETLEGTYLNDLINGGDGIDTMTGGDGADIFYFTDMDYKHDIADYVTDFDPSEDIILVGSGSYQAFESRNISYSQDGDDVMVSAGGVNVALLEGVSVGDMYADDGSNDTGYVTADISLDWVTSQGFDF